MAEASKKRQKIIEKAIKAESTCLVNAVLVKKQLVCSRVDFKANRSDLACCSSNNEKRRPFWQGGTQKGEKSLV